MKKRISLFWDVFVTIEVSVILLVMIYTGFIHG